MQTPDVPAPNPEVVARGALLSKERLSRTQGPTETPAQKQAREAREAVDKGRSLSASENLMRAQNQEFSPEKGRSAIERNIGTHVGANGERVYVDEGERERNTRIQKGKGIAEDLIIKGIDGIKARDGVSASERLKGIRSDAMRAVRENPGNEFLSQEDLDDAVDHVLRSEVFRQGLIEGYDETSSVRIEDNVTPAERKKAVVVRRQGRVGAELGAVRAQLNNSGEGSLQAQLDSLRRERTSSHPKQARIIDDEIQRIEGKIEGLSTSGRTLEADSEDLSADYDIASTDLTIVQAARRDAEGTYAEKWEGLVLQAARQAVLAETQAIERHEVARLQKMEVEAPDLISKTLLGDASNYVTRQIPTKKDKREYVPNVQNLKRDTDILFNPEKGGRDLITRRLQTLVDAGKISPEQMQAHLNNPELMKGMTTEYGIQIVRGHLLAGGKISVQQYDSLMQQGFGENIIQEAIARNKPVAASIEKKLKEQGVPIGKGGLAEYMKKKKGAMGLGMLLALLSIPAIFGSQMRGGFNYSHQAE